MKTMKTKPLFILCGAGHHGKVGKIDPLYFQLSQRKICQGRQLESYKWIETFGKTLYKCDALSKIFNNRTEGEKDPPTIKKYVDVYRTYSNAIYPYYRGVIENTLNATDFMMLTHDFIDQLYTELKPHFDVKGLVVYTRKYERVFEKYNTHFPTFAVNPYKITDDLWKFLKNDRI